MRILTERYNEMFNVFRLNPIHSSLSNIFTKQNISNVFVYFLYFNSLQMQVTELCLLSSVPQKEPKIVNENCIHFCLNSTKGDVDPEESDGFLGFLIPSMNPLDRISSLSQKAKCCYTFADYSKKHATRLFSLYT